jgi:hypothetical protein
MFPHFQQPLGEARANAEEVTGADLDTRLGHGAIETLKTDPDPLSPVERHEIDEHAAPLDTCDGELRDIQATFLNLVVACAEAVVKDLLGDAIAVGVETLPKVPKGVPLCRILRV